jgi:hypothetical protein
MSLRPRFSFSAGELSADSESPRSGPWRFVVERSLDTPIDALRISLADSGGVKPGDPVQLDLGDEENGLERVFTGTVAELRPRLNGCELFCLGNMLSLLELRVAAFYQSRTAGDIARDLLGQAGLDAGQVEDGIELPRFCVERRLCVHAQLRRLAQKLGFSLFGDRQGKIHFRGLGPAANLGTGGALGGLGAAAQAAASLLGGSGGAFEYRKHLLQAGGHLRPPLERKVVVGGESPTSGSGEDKSFWLTATDSDYEDSAGDGAELLIIDASARSKDMAGRLAAGYAALLNRRTADIRLRVLGQPALELGDSRAIDAAPESALNSQGYIKSLRHRFGSHEGFITDLVLSTEAAV